MILEHFANNDEETVLANSGMMLWSAMHEKYKQVEMGWKTNSDVSWAYHGSRGWNYPNLVDYMENHDQERIMFEALSNGNASGSYNIKDTATALHQMQMTTALFMGIPGPKMLWEFGELGYDYSIMFNGERTAAKPPRWDYFNEQERQDLYFVTAGMAQLRKSDAFRFGTFTSDLANTGKRLWIAHSSMDVVITCNMDVTTLSIAPGFTHAGRWYDYFTGESVNITDPAGQSFSFAPGTFRVFTSVQLPKPYYTVTVTVKDSLTSAVIQGAEVSYMGVGMKSSDATGKAVFIMATGTTPVTVKKTRYLTWTRTETIAGDLEITVLLQNDPHWGTVDRANESAVKIYPNPARHLVTIESDVPRHFSILAADGRVLTDHRMILNKETMDVSKFEPGVYLIRFSEGSSFFVRKIVIGKD